MIDAKATRTTDRSPYRKIEFLMNAARSASAAAALVRRENISFKEPLTAVYLADKLEDVARCAESSIKAIEDTML